MSAKRIVLAALMSAAISPLAQAVDFDTRPPEFVGGKEKQSYQNELAFALGATILGYDKDIEKEIQAGYMVRLYDSACHYNDKDLGSGYHDRELMYYIRPQVVEWLNNISCRYRDKFGKRIKVTSLVRTHGRHAQIQGWNPNAAQEIPTAHLTGYSLDVSKKGMSSAELAWMRQALAEMVRRREIVVIEEMYILNFHIFVVPDPQKQISEQRPVFAMAADNLCTSRN